jgi:hypothetical protein
VLAEVPFALDAAVAALDGLIASDKFCWTRYGQLRLAEWRRPLRTVRGEVRRSHVGIGTASCGPGVLPQHRLEAVPTTFAVSLSPLGRSRA